MSNVSQRQESDAKALLLRLGLLRLVASKITVPELEKAIIVLSDVLVERKEREEKIRSIISKMRIDGIDPEELLETGLQREKKTLPLKYKYFENGKTRYWTGVGKVPKVIKTALENGKLMADFLNDDLLSDDGIS